VDLLLRAYHVETEERFRGRAFVLRPGQLVTSVRMLMKDWGWSYGKTYRLLKRLQDEKMINHEANQIPNQEPNQCPSLITICNWGEYQHINEGDRITDRIANRISKRITIRGSKNDNKNDNKKYPPTPQAEIEFPPLWGERAQAAFAEWVEYRRQLKKPLLPKTLQSLVETYANNPRAFAAAVRYTINKGIQGLIEDPAFRQTAVHKTKAELNFERDMQIIEQS